MELVKVLSSPKGVKAVVSSAREVTVSPEPDAPSVVDSAVEVETTAVGRPALKIHVVRYAPVASR